MFGTLASSGFESDACAPLSVASKAVKQQLNYDSSNGPVILILGR